MTHDRNADLSDQGDDNRRVRENIPCARCGNNIRFETQAHQVSYTHEPLDYFYCSTWCRDAALWVGKS